MDLTPQAPVEVLIRQIQRRERLAWTILFAAKGSFESQRSKVEDGIDRLEFAVFGISKLIALKIIAVCPSASLICDAIRVEYKVSLGPLAI